MTTEITLAAEHIVNEFEFMTKKWLATPPQERETKLLLALNMVIALCAVYEKSEFLSLPKILNQIKETAQKGMIGNV